LGGIHPADQLFSPRTAFAGALSYGRPTGVGVWFDVGVVFGLLLLPIFLAHGGLQTVTVALLVLTGMPLPLISLLHATHFMTDLHSSANFVDRHAPWKRPARASSSLSTTTADVLKARSQSGFCMSPVHGRRTIGALSRRAVAARGAKSAGARADRVSERRVRTKPLDSWPEPAMSDPAKCSRPVKRGPLFTPQALQSHDVLHCRERSPFMQMRFNPASASPGGYKALYGLETYLASCGLESNLLHMLKLRTSQINGCAYCIDMHWKDLRAAGETEQRLYGLDAWREAPYYSARERAALEWVEALTHLTEGHVPDAVYELVRPHFSDKELADLTLAVAAINAWNRLAIAARTPAGGYKPRAH
jgi:AhpD family alkylhydroperoxidase